MREREAGVRRMFDGIAGQYDLMNRVMTLGQDQKWRRFVVERCGSVLTGPVLDLASGTGDIAALLHKTHPSAQVVGADFSVNMLAQARRRFAAENIAWQAVDANQLPYRDASFAAVTFGYLLRNVERVDRVLAEIHRVLKAGGMVVCLDTTPPEKNLLYPLIHLYFKMGIPLLGRMIARDEQAYAYLTGSTMGFYTAEKLAEAFTGAGFSDIGYRKFMMGTIAVHWGIK